MRIVSIIVAVLFASFTSAAPPSSQPVGKLPHIEVDAKNKQVRVECEALHVVAPLEFFCCVTGTNEHESVLRSKVKPSQLHLAMLMIGLEPGKPVSYSEATRKWTPPHGPPININCEFEKEGKTVRVPAYRMVRDIKTKKEMPPMTWIFTGSRTMDDGVYAADATGYLVSIVNFDLTVIDVPELASNANETLEWEINPQVMPEKGTKVTLIIEPAGTTTAPTTMSSDASAPQKIDMPLLKIDAAGNATLDARAVTNEQLSESLKDMREDRPLRVRLAAEPGLAEDRLRDVQQVVTAAGATVVLAAITPTTQTGEAVSSVKIDQQKVDHLKERWTREVAPREQALREAAQAHYEVVNSLRREQQRLIDEADRIQRTIDELEKNYQQMTTPRPEPVK